MKVFDNKLALRQYLVALPKSTKIGFVPTMGALHEGHLSLIEIAKQNSDIVVSSIFVNPKQFNDTNDYLKYPTSIDKDLELLLQVKCDVVYIPPVGEIYPASYIHQKVVDLGVLNEILEAAHRPGHFEGVVMVVDILLEIVKPNLLFLGQKDFQQVKVITALVEQHHPSIQIITCPTMREDDGLAMSSRNIRLNSVQRKIAANLYKALVGVKNNFAEKSIADSITEAKALLSKFEDIQLEYLEVVDYNTMKSKDIWSEKGCQVVCLAAKLGDIRLIDNLII